MGDANGVGPEILLRRFAAGRLGDDVLIYGDAAILRAGARLLRLDVLPHEVARAEAALPGRLNVVDSAALGAEDLAPGTASPKVGGAAREYVRRATLDALDGTVAGVVTLPLNKAATRAAAPGFVGHTEFVAGLCGADEFAMMLATREVAVAHVSAHVPLAEAIAQVTTARVGAVIRLADAALRRFLPQPRLAVCGLNPHAGEGGMFGGEDAERIAPAVAAARGRGIDVAGPLPADTVFHQAIRRRRFDGIVCMYHDQGHAPIKLVGFETAVNVTIGLPIVRTSVDHGTAFDIAWQGKAFTESLQAALDYAWKLYGGGWGPLGRSAAANARPHEAG